MAQHSFKDHFSGASDDYRRNRPSYPDSLFAYLASLAPASACAWDCATGTGQAAQGLARHFVQVIATDASGTQIDSAVQQSNISYRVASAEASGIASASVDLITVAQALHWFDIPAFFAEAERVLKPSGVLAVWSYNLLTVTPSIDAVIDELYSALLAAYWPAERRLVETGYREITFPFAPLAAPPFAMESDWNLAQLLGYLRTWSAVRRYLQERGNDPVELITPQLTQAWGTVEKRNVRWPLALHLGRRP